MARKTNQPKGFWYELKRRKVFNVVTVYAGTAFVIIQLVAAVKEPLHLPDWFPTIVIVLLCIGFVMAVFFSWVYEITPTGIKVTKPARTEKQAAQPIPKTSRGWKIATYASLVVIVSLVGWHFFPQIFPQDPVKRLQSAGGKLSVAVMPFQNLTKDEKWNIWEMGVQDNLINNLSAYSDELEIRQIESVNEMIDSRKISKNASIAPSVASNISTKLKASLFVSGSIYQEGSILRLNAKIADSKTGVAIKPFQIDGPYKEEYIMKLVDSLSTMIRNYLIISKLANEHDPPLRRAASTNSPEAYRFYIHGVEAFRQMDYQTAREWLHKSIAKDSNFFYAIRKLSIAYLNEGLYDQAKKWCLVAYNNRDHLPEKMQLDISKVYASCFGTPWEEIKYLKQLLEIDNQDQNFQYNLAISYNKLQQYEKAIPEFKKFFDLIKDWDLKVLWLVNFGYTYHMIGDYRNEKKVYQQAERIFPDNPFLLWRQALFAFCQKKTKEAQSITDKFILISKQNSVTEATIAFHLGHLYWEAGMLDKAEESFRKMVALEPDASSGINPLSYFLIKSDRNIEEGIRLAEKVLAINLENFGGLRMKGWGLYKQGRYKEAFNLLDKSWNLRMKQAVYDHEAWLNLEAARKAVGEMK